jgi:hypothetical protein
MADGISFKMVTAPFHAAIKQRQARMPGAARFAVREGGRVARKAARAKAPVLADKTAVSAGAYQRAFKQRKLGTAGPIQGEGGPVRGLLRASITPSRNLKSLGSSEFSLKVGPRGPRAHLYAQKEERKHGYMAAGDEAAKAAMAAIAAAAFNRVWRE